MGQDFWRSEREAARAREVEPAPSGKSTFQAVLEADRQGYSWEDYMAELRRKYEGVSNH
jgi:hypothetical protein